MPDGLRTIRVLTNDEALLASARCAAEAHEGWDVVTQRPDTRSIYISTLSVCCCWLANWITRKFCAETSAGQTNRPRTTDVVRLMIILSGSF